LSRCDLSEAEWRLLEPLLPPARGRKSRPAFDNRQIVNGSLWRISDARGIPLVFHLTPGEAAGSSQRAN
jgi:transposase